MSPAHSGPTRRRAFRQLPGGALANGWLSLTEGALPWDNSNTSYSQNSACDASLAPVEQPIDGVVHPALHRLLVLEPLVLAGIEKPQNDDHAEAVRLVEHAPEAVEV